MKTRNATVRILLIVIGLVLFPGIAAAAGALEQLQAQVARVVEILQGGNGETGRGAADRRAALREIVSDLFDFEEMAARALGPHWQARTAAERVEFVGLFAGLLEGIYLAKVEKYGDERVTYVEALGDGNATTVRTRIVPAQGAELPVDYRMRRRDAGWRVHDVVIDGVSLVENFRTQFGRIIRTSSYGDLITRIQALEGGQASPGARPR